MTESQVNEVAADHGDEQLPETADWSGAPIGQRYRLWRKRKDIPEQLPWVQASPWAADNYLFAVIATMAIWFPLAAALGLVGFRWIMMIALAVPMSALGVLGLMTGRNMSLVTVDESGIWLRHRGLRWWPTGRVLRLAADRFLPASEIGQTWIIEGGAIMTVQSFFAFNKMPIGQGQSTVERHATTALLIQQTRKGLETDYWLLAYNQPESLAAAVALSAEGAWRGETTSERLQELYGIRPVSFDQPEEGTETMTSYVAAERTMTKLEPAEGELLPHGTGGPQDRRPPLLRGTVDVFTRSVAMGGCRDGSDR